MLKVKVAMLVAVLVLIGLHVYEIVEAHKVHASDGGMRIVFDPVRVSDYNDGQPLDSHLDGAPRFHWECPTNTIPVAPYKNPTVNISGHGAWLQMPVQINTWTESDGKTHSDYSINQYFGDWPAPICIAR